tara:strand:- start:14103 stop:15497 length:1395 start_codon:yes stop_codon:yes gene_type:complete
MIIFIPIETNIREKIPKIFLAYKILKLTNFKVIIGGQRYLNHKIEKFKNCVWLDKHTFHERLKNRKIDRSNHIVVLDEEGPISLHDKFTKETLYSQFFFKLINTLILWGNEDYANLPQINKKKVNMEVHGHPKFDLLKKNYRGMFDDEIKYIKKKYKNFVFIPGNLHVDDRSDEFISITRSWAKKYNVRESIIKKFLNYNFMERKNYLDFLKFIKRLAIKNPKMTFVLRKHPIEDENKLIEFLGEIPKNLKLEYKFTVTPWIIACDYYLHSGCTTAIEAAILKKKIIFYATKSIANHKKFQKFKFSNLNFTNDDNCISFFNNINKKKINYKMKNIGNFIYNNNSNKLFYEKFTSFLKKIKFEDHSKIYYRKDKKFIFSFVSDKLKKMIYAILSLIKNKVILKTFLKKYLPEKYIFGKDAALKKFKSLKKSEINRIMLRLNKLHKNKIKIKNTKISESVFKLERI